MKKSMVALLLAAALLTGSSLAEQVQRVEIAFQTGDSVLWINGAQVETEPPYVAGTGTTMVPLRVITEAFGASVNWNGEDQTIIIVEGKRVVVLQIDNDTAFVGEESCKLDVAPVVLGVGTTMVPLRFLCETFGADVDYDGETQGVHVVREAQKELAQVDNSPGSAECILASAGGDFPHILAARDDSWSLVIPAEWEVVTQENGRFIFQKDGKLLYVQLYQAPQTDAEGFRDLVEDSKQERLKATELGGVSPASTLLEELRVETVSQKDFYRYALQTQQAQFQGKSIIYTTLQKGIIFEFGYMTGLDDQEEGPLQDLLKAFK